MKRAFPFSLHFVCARGSLRARARGGRQVAHVLVVREGQYPAPHSMKKPRNGGCGALGVAALESYVKVPYTLRQPGLATLSYDSLWGDFLFKAGCCGISGANSSLTPRLTSSRGERVVKDSGCDRQQLKLLARAAQVHTVDQKLEFQEQHESVISPWDGATSTMTAAQHRQRLRRMLFTSNNEPCSSRNIHSLPGAESSFPEKQSPHDNERLSDARQFPVPPPGQVHSSSNAYDSFQDLNALNHMYYPSEFVAAPYGSQVQSGTYSEQGAPYNAPPPSSSAHIGPQGINQPLGGSGSLASISPLLTNKVPLAQQQPHTQVYPASLRQPNATESSTLSVSSVSGAQSFHFMRGVQSEEDFPSPGVPRRDANAMLYSGGSLDSSRPGASVFESSVGLPPSGYAAAGGSGEERLEQLLAEIRQRLGNRANTYDSALEQDPRALLQLACRPESLRRMQHSSLDWWYVLFRWQDRYHAMQLSGEIRRRNAAAAGLVPSSTGTAGRVSQRAGAEAKDMRTSGTSRSRMFSFFSPEDEETFFTFLQKLQQAFAARSLSEEAQTHGRLHDRMRCIRQLARIVSDDHRALGMGAAARKEADSLLWSLALQEARCASNSIDILRAKGGMPMLLSILRLAETADRRRRRSATRVLVPLNEGRQDKKGASCSNATNDNRQKDVIIQEFEGGRELQWQWISAEETQDVFDKLADAFLRCAQEANIEPCVHAVVGMGTLAEKFFLYEEKWQKVCQAMTERLKLSEMVSAGSEAGLLLDSLTWMFVRNANASRRCRHVIFQVNFLLGQILRDTRSDVVARCVLGLALCRVFREENLLFYTSVLLKRQLRSDEPRKSLTPRAFCNLLVANAIAGISAKQHLGVLVKNLLNTGATRDRVKNFSLDESARLAWAICALQLYDTSIAGSQWPAHEAAELLAHLLSRTGKLVDGPQAAYILEALRDSHDWVAPLYPDINLTENYADQEVRQKACSAYDQSHLGLGGTLITIIRGALRSFGGTVKPGLERRSLLTRLRKVASPPLSPDTSSEAADQHSPRGPASSGEAESGIMGNRSNGGPEQSARAPSECKVAGTGDSAESAASKDEATSEFTISRNEVRCDKDGVKSVSGGDEHAESSPTASVTASHTLSAAPGCHGDISVEQLREAEWIEGAILDGYPVAFYSPNLKVALDVDVCSKLPSKYMKRRHMDGFLRKQGIRYVLFCTDLKKAGEPLYPFLERLLRDESGTLSEVGLRPIDVRAHLRTSRNSLTAYTDTD